MHFSWTSIHSELVKAARVRHVNKPDRRNTLKVVHLSDIHVDHEYATVRNTDMNVYDISMYCKIQVLFPPHCPCYDVPKARNFRYFYAVADCAGA